MQKKMLPLGTEDFAELRTMNKYYVDKTLLIKDLLNSEGKVTLFTRPRRFGKTLNMSMLQYFFEISRADSSGRIVKPEELFAGLSISSEKELCAQHMGKYPVVFITLKEVKGSDFQQAYGELGTAIRYEAFRHEYLKYSDRLSEDEKLPFRRLLRGEETRQDLTASLKLLTRLLTRHYGQKTILLIDEYDVPLDKAYLNGYYDEMIDIIRNMFGQALKTNDNLNFAVLTGCLRVSKESIFTGLNNLDVFSVLDEQFAGFFGFTENEVLAMLNYYDLQAHYKDMKEWYDGYRFGEQDIYCPWDVVKYCRDLQKLKSPEPQAYWLNSSGNDMVRRLLDKARTGTIRLEVEKLLAGQTIVKALNDKLTHNEIDRDINNVWSMLFMTGYLTLAGRPRRGLYELVIPNKEVREIYQEQVLVWLEDKAALKANANLLTDLYAAFASGNAQAVQEMLNKELLTTISFYDAYESFYHGFLLALLNTCAAWQVTSNKEYGRGRSDITVESIDNQLGMVIEIKRVKDLKAGSNLQNIQAFKAANESEAVNKPEAASKPEAVNKPETAAAFKNSKELRELREQALANACGLALQQIIANDYAAILCQNMLPEIWIYGIAFCGKQCMVAAQKLS